MAEIEAGYKFIGYYTSSGKQRKVTKYLDDDELEPKNIKIRTSDSYWNSRHRVFLSATLHKKLGNLGASHGFNVREQGQKRFGNIDESLWHEIYAERMGQ